MNIHPPLCEIKPFARWFSAKSREKMPFRLANPSPRMYCYNTISPSYLFERQTMSELSFLTFCIEFYSRHIQKPGPEVYRLFRESGLLDMLKTDYEDLHGMGQEALMQFFDEYLAKELSR